MSPAHLRLNPRKKYLTARFADRKQSYDPPENLSLFNPPLEAPEPTDKDLIKWVQRSLNNTQGTNLVTDGLNTAEYRKALRDFNARYNGRDYDDWDRRTQDDLIFRNEGNKKYIGWLTQALGRLGYGGLSPSEVISSMIVSAVRSFQSTSGLRVDGFVGPKTEFALINASGLKPPGALRRTNPVSPRRRPARPAKTLDHYLDRIAGRIAPYKRCVLQKLLDPQASHKYLSPRGIRAFFSESVLKRPHRIGEHYEFFVDMRQQLQRRLEIIKDVPTRDSIEARLEHAFDGYYLDLYDGIRALEFAVCNDPRTPAMRRTIFQERNYSNSLYNCPAPRKKIEEVMSNLGGLFGVNPEYGCVA